MMVLRRFLADQRGSGTTSSAVRIGLFVVAALALIGVAYVKVIQPLMSHAQTCASNAATSTSGIATGAGATLSGC